LPEAQAAICTRDVLADAAAALADALCDTPRLDAELLLAEALGVERERLVLDARDPIEADTLARFDALLARRAAREPVAYILGRREFRQITLAVDRRALIPRPETELLVEVGLGLPAGVRIVDVGTGSGAVALALKDERPDLDVWATELDPGALELARENAGRLGLDVSFFGADLLDGVPGPFAAVLANLPYVCEGAELQPEIARYEPAGALYAGADGLNAIRRLAPSVEGVPLVALEVGAGQVDAVEAILRESGFASVERLRDLAGHERVVVARV
jgi:release factor glutamine methyltransferase